MALDYKIIVYIFFGILPSLVWLSYYLRKDLHPEPKRMIIKIFLWGAVITLPVFFVQMGLTYILGLLNLGPILYAVIYWFLVIAFSEEIFKYFVIKIKVINSPDFDEPLDIMLYMVVAALGFAALENVLYLFSPTGQLSFNELIYKTSAVALIRFIGATFLHTLCSAVIGYAAALSFTRNQKKKIIFLTGLFFATLLHGAYDFSIMQLEGYARIAFPAAVIIILAFAVFYGFEKLKQIKSVTILN